MSQSGQESNKTDLGSVFSNAFSLGGQVACLNLVVIFVSLFAGIWLDKLLGTKPAITLVFVLGSVPFALVLTYYLAKRKAMILSQPTKRDESLQREEKHSGE
ncbi:MAG: AtpZ/AtpI family protein [Anaerolineales bacterium]|nr:AtpZ/AtpI family protein [Anaerolineales bacterium]